LTSLPDDRGYLLGKVQGFLEAFATLNGDGNESSWGMLFPLPEAETLEAACWKLVRSACSPNWHQKLRRLEMVSAGESWRERLSEELVGEALPGGYLLQLMGYQGDDAGRDAIYRTTLRLLENLFGGTPIRVWHATWFDAKSESISPWAWLSASEWIFETHTGSYFLVLAHDG
jgi:hypothetical protein